MLNNKKVLALSLAATITMTPVMGLAEKVGGNVENKDVETNVAVPVSKEVEAKYSNFTGKVLEVNEKSLLLENTEVKGDKLVAHIGEDVILLDDKDGVVIEASKIKKGDKVSLLFPANTPVTSSEPGQMTPELIVLRNNTKAMNVTLDEFNKEDTGRLTSTDNMIALNIFEDTKVVNLEGEKVSHDELDGRKLVVFYDIMTMSIPGQTSPKKVIVLENTNMFEVSELDKVVLEGKEVKLEDGLYRDEDENLMMPLREIVEELGYEVKWNQEDFSIELVKGPQWTSLKIGENRYSFAKMAAFELEAAPVLKDAKTYVPVSFVKEVF